MKLASVSVGGRRLLVIEGADGALIDASRLVGRDHLDMNAVLAEGEELLNALRRRVADGVVETVVDPAAVRWLPPSPNPSKIIGVAVNNRSIAQYAHRPPTEPAYFLKPPSALVGHGDPIVVPSEFGLTHPEPELAAVIGRRVRNLTVEGALDAVLGFTIINDITSPSLKDRDSMELTPTVGAIGPVELDWREVRGPEDRSVYLTYHARSKGCDSFAPMGPWLVTTEAVGDPNNLDVTCLLDDEVILADSTSRLTFSVETVLAHLTEYMTLEPGDVVHFGTAVKVAAPARFPTVRHVDLSRLEGTLSVEIGGVGRLDNPIKRA
ncbi:fumarylacetoacetate hydrolase family protein [Mycolicibacterium thermoresistibile]|uniref:Fumarylacetoacetate (FAA) hydrolase n=2 Tax=Mycolicibacterium thermoresistibile TaxID=1797 RepID=G7CAY4_MYCT3|nr:fumarylacetoacetate hydrolase family protein [Mycolicibacterium thermoresistibile]HLT11432.1 fumarylacetoacetate hydrolase family protein [Micromonosporaceae bacterium]EHI14838.1 fumarylacetoacetate (FAA) hydrolase [Mycolicibacterium thermoresistibile ATCC 19527]MCV7190807.1 fumarylacetoacetate hydrolase family protein [Mycolicibacterium thermoresistibile]SNW18646.1 fumarylacetoacetate (FAA) hydrolase [Mycolicibacterium thermoresistibile]GAT16216.1 fumarylacetoacetate (FAA) hydrolase [Mycol